MLAGVHQRERHHGRVGQQHRPPPPADPAEEEHHHEQGEGRVQRRHRRHRIGRPLARVQHVARAVQADRPPAPGRDTDHVGKQPELGRPPGRRGRIGEVGDQSQRRQGEPPPHERRPQRAPPQPQHHRDAQGGDEVREVHPTGDHVVPPDRVRVVQMLLQPHRGHVPAEHEPVGLDQLGRVRGSPLVGQAPGEVVHHQQHHDRQPVAGELQVHPARLVDPDGDRGEPEPPEREDRVGERKTQQDPPGDKADTPERDRDRPLAGGIGLWRGCHRHLG